MKHLRINKARAVTATVAAILAAVMWAPPAQAAGGPPAASATARAAASGSAVTASTGTVYYVSTDGNDANTGLSPDSAWRSLDKVNATTFSPGDSVLFEAGDAWTGQLWPKGSGTADAPITIGEYGGGAKPKIEGAGKVDDAVRLFNQQHWTISDLDVSNERSGGATAADNLGDLRGIHVYGDDSTTLSGFTISGVDVHDVTGEVDWIGGSTSDDAPGIKFQTGWDGSKRTGGIVFETTVPDITNPPSTPTILNDITVQGSTVINTSFAGIIVKQYTGDGRDSSGTQIATDTGWGTRTSADDPKFAPHTNVTIRGNYLRQDGTAYGCDGIYLTDVRGGLIENNVIQKAGTSGIEMYYADKITVQHNEVYDTQKKAGGADSNGIDPDKATTNIVVQYNYLHGNGDGILLCEFSFGNAVVRFNVIADNNRYPIYLHSDSSATAKIYRNTIYNTVSNYLIYGQDANLKSTYDIRDNLLHSGKNATLSTSATTTYDNNVYSGAEEAPATDAHALVGDVSFVNPDVTGPYGTATTGPAFATAGGYAPTAGALPVNTGSSANPDDGGLDFAGNTSRVGAPDVGAFEYATPAGATSEALSGFVRSSTGTPLADTSVTVKSGTTTRTATTDAHGWFTVTGVPLGTATVTATRSGWKGDPVQVVVGGGTSGLAQLVLTSTSTTGSVSGRVLDVKGAALGGATVVVSSGGKQLRATTSAADGSYTLTEVPVGEGYSVKATADGMRSATVGDVAVDPAATTKVAALLLQPDEPAVIYADDVESRSVGTFDSQDGYTVSQAGGSVDVVQQTDNRAFKLTRTTNSGSTSLARNYATPLTGIVTVEGKVMRDDTLKPSNANWFSVPYLYGADGKPLVSVAFSAGNIVAYQGASSTTLMPYEDGHWYDVSLVVDTVNATYSLSIDGKLIVSDAALRNPVQGGIAQIEYNANSSNYGSLYVDDLRILQGSEPDRSNAQVAALDTDAGTPTKVDADTWQLDVPARTAQARVTVTPAADVVKGITVDGIAATAGEPSAPVALAEGTNDIPIVVTAQDGSTQHTTTLRVVRAPLAGDATLSALTVTPGQLKPAFDPDTTAYAVTLPAGSTSLTLSPTATGPSSTITVDGKAVSSGAIATSAVKDGSVVPVVVSSADGTASITYKVTVHIPLPPDPAPPARAELSTTAGWSGLQDGNYDVQLNLWWGTNARQWRLYENGKLIATIPLSYDGNQAQHAVVPVSGRHNGTYVYTGELVNNAGTTATSSVTVKVTQAAPGTPSLRAEGSGTTRTLITDMWWGTNATGYELWLDGKKIDSRTLTAATPAAQHVETVVQNLTPGKHEFYSVLSNAAGETRSKTLEVTVK